MEASKMSNSTESRVEYSTTFITSSTLKQQQQQHLQKQQLQQQQNENDTPPPRPPLPEEKNFDEDFGTESRFSTFERSGNFDKLIPTRQSCSWVDEL